MRGEVQSIEANDVPDWPRWRPANVAEERQWFTVKIGPFGGKGGDLFQVCVASVAWLREIHRGKFVGLTVERIDAVSVIRAIQQRIALVEAATWEQFALALAPELKWEYMGTASTG